MIRGRTTRGLAKTNDESEKILKSDLDDFDKQKTSLKNFKDSLIHYIAENTEEGKPVVFFVDELDRCNPHFAVKILERIKHLFDIPNVVFVLSIAKNQLEYAIQGYYGSSNIDAANYLRRFIDVEFTLPKADPDKFCQFLYEYYDFGSVFNSKERVQHNEFRSDESTFQQITNTLIGNVDIDLRTADKIFVHTRLALCTCSSNTYIIPDVFFLMCFIKVVDSQFYDKIKVHKYTAQQLLSKMEEYLPVSILKGNDEYDKTPRQMAHCLISLLNMYDINSNGNVIEKVFELKEGDEQKLSCDIIDKDLFNQIYKWKTERAPFREIPLANLLKKIDLQHSFIK